MFLILKITQPRASKIITLVGRKRIPWIGYKILVLRLYHELINHDDVYNNSTYLTSLWRPCLVLDVPEFTWWCKTVNCIIDVFISIVDGYLKFVFPPRISRWSRWRIFISYTRAFDSSAIETRPPHARPCTIWCPITSDTQVIFARSWYRWSAYEYRVRIILAGLKAAIKNAAWRKVWQNSD